MSKIQKFLGLTVLIVSLCGLSAFADEAPTQRMQKLLQRLAQVETHLNPNDLQALDYYLGGIDRLLDRYPSAVRRLVCLSNGDSGSFEKFRVSDVSTGTPYGGMTTLENCRLGIAGQNQDLVCLSNGDSGAFEKFVTFDLALGKNLGLPTALKTCSALVTSARSSLVCISNGEFGSFEKFRLFNRDLGRGLGGETGLEQCLGSITAAVRR